MPHSYVDVVVKRPVPLRLLSDRAVREATLSGRSTTHNRFSAESENADTERYFSVAIGVARKIVETQIIETLLCA